MHGKEMPLFGHFPMTWSSQLPWGHPGQVQASLNCKKMLRMSSQNMLACHFCCIDPGLLAGIRVSV